MRIKKFNEYNEYVDEYEEMDIPEEQYLYIDYSQIPNGGWGLYTRIDIEEDALIAVFHGEILTDDEVEERIESNDDQYFMETPAGEILDCKFIDGFAKYANDAEGVKTTFKNNSYIGVDDDGRIVLIATRDIEADEEIFTGYGKAYWKKHSKSL